MSTQHPVENGLLRIEECVDPTLLIEAMVQAGAWYVIDATMDTADRMPSAKVYGDTVKDVRAWLAAREAAAKADVLREVAETVAAIRDENPPSAERPSKAASAYTSGWLQAIAEVFVVLDGVRETCVTPPEEGQRP